MVVCYTFPSYSQHLAGYLGRQITVYGNVKSFFRVRDAAKENQPPLNLKLAGGVDFVVSKRVSLAFEIESFKSSTNLSVFAFYLVVCNPSSL